MHDTTLAGVHQQKGQKEKPGKLPLSEKSSNYKLKNGRYGFAIQSR